jgi:hypothetical protein
MAAHPLPQAWLQEFLDASTVTVANNPAFEENDMAVANPAFSPRDT